MIRRDRRIPEQRDVQAAADGDTGTEIGVLVGIIGAGSLLLLMVGLLVRGSYYPLLWMLAAFLVVGIVAAVAWVGERRWRKRNPTAR